MLAFLSVMLYYQTNARKLILPFSTCLKGCCFHFTQSGWRFVQNNNMANNYLSDDDQQFKLLVKCVLCLPHVPVEDIQETIDLLKTKDWDFDGSEEKLAFKDKMLKYVEDFWVNGPIPPQVWNCFHREVDLTNNSCSCERVNTG